jgi:hypothetical protein
VETDTEAGQYRVGLTLPNANGDTVNATLAISARWALSDALAFDVAAQGSLVPDLELNLGAVYRSDLWRVGARLETNLDATPQATLRLNAAVTPTPDIVLAPTLELRLETLAVQFGISAAIRQTDWIVLTEHALVLDPAQPWRDGARGQISAGWNVRSGFAVRVGLRYRLEGGIFTTLLSLGSSTQLTDSLSLGARAQLEWQPVTDTTRFAFGVEIGYDLGGGARAILGLNTVGFTSPWDASTAPGAYLRLEYRLDALFALLK